MRPCWPQGRIRTIFENAFFENFANFWRARSRLYQIEILQENMRSTAFFKLYKICILLHRCNLKIFAKNRLEKTAIFVKFQQKKLQMSQNSQNLPNFIDFEKCCKTHILLQKSEPIQPKTSNILPKFCQPTLSDVSAVRSSSRRMQNPDWSGQVRKAARLADILPIGSRPARTEATSSAVPFQAPWGTAPLFSNVSGGKIKDDEILPNINVEFCLV